MSKKPTSTLLIATYNWPQALEQTLLSVKRQEVLPNEVIIADDGSKEETGKLIADFQASFPVPLRHIWQRDEGFKLGQIRNKAIAAATSDYIIQIDGDLILHPAFIKDHVQAARPGHFIGGSRVLLSEELSKQVFQHKPQHISLFEKGVRNKFNALHAPALARFIELFKKEKGLYNLRGCNMSFWRSDLLAVNGYNEQITGWGREDTELVIRLYNKGIQRVYFKLQGIVYHLYHKEYDRTSVLKNDEVVQQAIENKSTWCEKGVAQYL
ncbi:MULTISPECIES: glycosyltransferase family 2 protein [Niastella]|uniref:Glycosyltransferase family 2 protein n=1 Tax=Niastella soli TaxID=2821487 RepID=A0ABS3YPW2_9BACT|nr:glycosyltransferase family 2 protein [Niastella soli]MBO9199936.1 glycosyltransferase family 2 protein [Niastella soli]